MEKARFKTIIFFAFVLSLSFNAFSMKPPKASGEPLVHETYADVPWQQKLGTFDGNSFTVPFAIPYDGLTPSAKSKCVYEGLSPGECMLKYGIVNVIGIERIDTAYQKNEVEQCQSGNCVEVILKVGNYSTQKTGSPEAIVFGDAEAGVPYKGYVISIGTLYAPQIPWYLSHYCHGDTPGNVCYADYFTDIIDVFKGIEGTDGIFPATRPWHVFNHDPSGRCPPGQTICSMQLGALDLQPLSLDKRLFPQENAEVISAFNQARMQFKDEGKFPWHDTENLSFTSLLDSVTNNPFLGYFEKTSYAPRTRAEGPNHFLYPSRCYFNDLQQNPDALRQCGINYEIHHGGFLYNADGEEQWPGSQYMLEENTYSRTAFMYAGLPAEALPIANRRLDDGMSLREKVETASIFTVYMPIVNAASEIQPMNRPYNIDFWHTLYLTNHRIMGINEFVSGLRGKILFHDEYRSRNLYKKQDPEQEKKLKSFPYHFPASTKYKSRSQRFNATSCDACHIRNGSGLPLKRQKNNPMPVMTDKLGTDRNFILTEDYTFTHTPALMGLRFVDLKNATENTLDQDGTFTNKIMNYYGNMFYVNGERKDGAFSWELQPLQNRILVDKTERQGYLPKEVIFNDFNTALDNVNDCTTYFTPAPNSALASFWPQSCQDVNQQGILNALHHSDVGVILLNANRLVGMNVLEALPNAFIKHTQQQQARLFGNQSIAGQINWVPGSRGGEDIKYCTEKNKNELNCYIGRFGWSAAAGTLEDQSSGAAAYPELNISASEGADKGLPFRFKGAHCGPANKRCLDSEPDSDLTEEQIKNIADYMRWLGVFNRSEYQVSQPIVSKGEQIFRHLQCDRCHVINKINLDYQDNVLPDALRKRLKDLTTSNNTPFVSYVGTDLLVHDMGYLSQSAPTPKGVDIRDSDGVIKPAYEHFIYKFRTPPLMNMRFNRLVNDSHRNGNSNCDFLLHDGRACDAIEAAFLHDGPAVKALDMIENLNALSAEDLKALRAFLYSL